jgi:hypothetical protein
MTRATHKKAKKRAGVKAQKIQNKNVLKARRGAKHIIKKARREIKERGK